MESLSNYMNIAEHKKFPNIPRNIAGILADFGSNGGTPRETNCFLTQTFQNTAKISIYFSKYRGYFSRYLVELEETPSHDTNCFFVFWPVNFFIETGVSYGKLKFNVGVSPWQKRWEISCVLPRVYEHLPDNTASHTKATFLTVTP